jgi:hypothetical protein
MSTRVLGPGHEAREGVGSKASYTHKHQLRENRRKNSSEVEKTSGEPETSSTTEAEQSERPKPSAYVAPIPKVGSIPSLSIPDDINRGKSENGGISEHHRPQLPPAVGKFLVGKLVDDSGDIVDGQTGQVLARAGGDLPSIVGRRVANAHGDILGDDGELLGFVADLELPGALPKPRSLADLMGRGSAALMVDHAGNILDANGNVVGKFHDNNNPLHRKEREEKETEKKKVSRMETDGSPKLKNKNKEEEDEGEQGTSQPDQPRPRRSESERRRNAESWRKENPGESPSDIFLDVKSTTEGIQLTIRIPTVFNNGQQVRPNISFS